MYKTYGKNSHRPYAPMGKLLLVMRLTFLVVLGAAMHVSASGIAQKITLHERNASLRNVLTELQRQSHYDFIYTNEQLALSKAVSLDVQSVDLRDVLNQLFSDQPLTFMIDDHSIIIRDKPGVKTSPINAKPPEGPPGNKVVGIVLDEKGNPIAGASVQTKHSSAGASTDKNGYFMLKEVQEKDTLIVSFIGYRTRSIPVSNNIMLTIKMEETTDALDEVIIQAYGHTTQRLTTANIGRVTATEIAKQPVTDPLLAIEGRIAGVVVTPQSGYEAGPVKVEIRGRKSLNSSFTSDPLYVIDGVPLTILDVAGTIRNDLSTSNISRGMDQTGLSISLGQSPMYNINPADIESIDVLKDADATAIYGSRGANGVILITTKRGKPGTNVFDLQVAEGISFNTRAWPLLNTPQYLEMRRQAFRNDGIVPTVLNAPDLFLWDTTRYVNWQKAAYGGVGKNLHLTSSISGGTAQTTFRVGAGYDRITDITRVAGANQRATVAININNTSANKRFQTAISANYAYSLLNQVSMDRQANLPPNAPPPYDSSGKLNFRQWDLAGVQLPFTALLQPYNSRTNAISTNLSLSYLILKDLRAAVSFGYNNNQAYQSRLTPIASQDPYSLIKPTGINNYGNSRSNNWIIEPQLTYSTFSGRHKFDFLAGATAQSNVTDGLLVTGSGYTSDIFLHSLSLAPVQKTMDNYGEYKYSGIFGRITYNYANKYILNINGRRDGSSRFGPGDQFGNFGSVGAAWIASDEPFIRQLIPAALSFFKLRGSYGITGSDAVGDYQFLSQWGNSSGLSNYDNIVPLLPQLEANPKFHWQVNKKLEAAIQTQWFHGLLSLDVVYYRDRCNNQLVSMPLPQFTGFTSVTANRPANVQNSGLEITMSAIILHNQDFQWQASFNIGINRNKLLGYPNLDQSADRNTYKVGTSLNNYYALNYGGVDPLTGKFTFTDYNHDGQVTVNEQVFPGTGNDDRYIVIDREPAYTGGLSTSVTYKQLTVSTSFNFVRQKGINLLFGGSSGATSSTAGGLTNISKYVYDHSWTHPGQTDALFTRESNSPIISIQMTSSNSGWSDASYLRCSNLYISYSLPATVLRRAHIRGLAINASTYNLFVISPYKGLDPEVRTYGGLPPARKINAGLTFSF